MNQEKKANVFIVDDHAIVRYGIRKLLEQDGRYQVCGEAASSAEAFPRIEKMQVDLVIIDISLRGNNGLELIKNLRAIRPELYVLVISMLEKDVYCPRALAAGARGYMEKTTSSENILVAVEWILAGNIWQEPDRGDITDTALELDKLSDRELEVFELIGNGMDKHHIARSLGISVKTVESHRESMKRKLKIPSIKELVRSAVAAFKFKRI